MNTRANGFSMNSVVAKTANVSYLSNVQTDLFPVAKDILHSAAVNEINAADLLCSLLEGLAVEDQNLPELQNLFNSLT